MAELDDFLGDEPGQPGGAASEGGAAPEGAGGVPASDAPSGAKPGEAAAGASPAASDGVKPADGVAADPTPPEPEDVTGLKSALQATRRERTDYKGERDRLLGERAALQAQLEAARAPAAAPAAVPVPQEAPAIPSPLEDPAAYHAYQERMRFNERLNMSEVMVRAQHPDLDEKLAVFKRAMDANPALRAELNRNVHPYQFVYEQGQRLMAMEEIGTDPAAFRAKVEAEIRAKLEAEIVGAQPVVQGQPRVQLPQSLGGVRSAASRSTPVINVPEAFDDILAPVRR